MAFLALPSSSRDHSLMRAVELIERKRDGDTLAPADVRELVLAYAAGRNAAGRIHEEGEFADVGATVNAWLGGKSPGKRLPGRAIEL